MGGGEGLSFAHCCGRQVLSISSPQLLLLRGCSSRQYADGLDEGPGAETLQNGPTLCPNASARCADELCRRQSNLVHAPTFNPQTDDVKLSLQKTLAINYQFPENFDLDAFENAELKMCDLKSWRGSNNVCKLPISSSDDLFSVDDSKFNMLNASAQIKDVSIERGQGSLVYEPSPVKEVIQKANGPTDAPSCYVGAELENSRWNTL